MSFDSIVIGHRGYPERYPENSLVGVAAAIEAGAGGVEVDVHLSRDGVPVVIHDANLQRTSNRDWPVPIHQLSLAQLRQASVHEPSRFGQQFAPCNLCTLEELCEAYAPCAKPLFIELKCEALQAFTARQFVAAVAHASREISADLRFLIAYDRGIVDAAKNHFACQTGWILESFSRANLALASQLMVDVLISDINHLDSLTQITEQAWSWFLYDIVDPELARQCSAQGVKYIESWNPPLLLSD